MAKALEYYREAQEIYIKIYGRNHFKVAEIHNNIGAIYLAAENPRNALQEFNYARDIEKCFCEVHPTVAVTFNNLGDTWLTLGRKKEAIECLLQSLKINEKTYGQIHHTMVKVCSNLGSAYQQFGEPKKALVYLEKGLAIFKKLEAQNPLDEVKLLGNLGSTWIDLYDINRAREYCE